jgi:hypothetical protein
MAMLNNQMVDAFKRLILGYLNLPFSTDFPEGLLSARNCWRACGRRKASPLRRPGHH